MTGGGFNPATARQGVPLILVGLVMSMTAGGPVWTGAVIDESGLLPSYGCGPGHGHPDAGRALSCARRAPASRAASLAPRPVPAGRRTGRLAGSGDGTAASHARIALLQVSLRMTWSPAGTRWTVTVIDSPAGRVVFTCNVGHPQMESAFACALLAAARRGSWPPGVP